MSVGNSYVGRKYVIEIEQEYSANMRKGTSDMVDPIKLYKVKGFNSLVFDEQGLDKLERMPTLEQIEAREAAIDIFQKTAYENGLHDAWEIAKKIECMDGYDGDKLFEIFGTDVVESIFKKYTASEVLEKVKAYEEQKTKTFNGEIEVGDEIIVKVPHTNKEVSGIVYKIGHADTLLMYYCISFVGNHVFVTPCDQAIKKTGRHFPQITDLMSEISTP